LDVSRLAALYSGLTFCRYVSKAVQHVNAGEIFAANKEGAPRSNPSLSTLTSGDFCSTASPGIGRDSAADSAPKLFINSTERQDQNERPYFGSSFLATTGKSEQIASTSFFFLAV
jgi:hypothetical protein